MTDTVPTTRGPRLALPSFVPDLFARADRPFLTILASWALCSLGAWAIALALSSFITEASAPDFTAYAGKGAFTVIVLAVITPILETLILALFCGLLSRFFSPVVTILLSSFGWAIAHSLQAPIWGLVIWWPFIIFSMLYLVWRQRSWWWAIAIPSIVHGLNNLPPALSIAYPDLIKLPV